MSAMSNNGTKNNGNGVSSQSRYVYWGAAVGILASLATLFVIVYFYGQSIGLGAAGCALLSCTMTLLLSQPAGIVGIIAGGLVGAFCGFIAHRLRAS
jgi:hypothetical protein